LDDQILQINFIGLSQKRNIAGCQTYDTSAKWHAESFPWHAAFTVV